MPIADTDLLRALQAVVDPETGRDFVSAKQLRTCASRAATSPSTSSSAIRRARRSMR
jgi:hypothetical protein